MLEQDRLLLRPWAPRSTLPGADGVGPDWVRPIVDPATEAPLGFATWQPPRYSGWLDWLSPPVLEVREVEESPLVCTAERSLLWTSRWQVRDADRSLVGSLRHYALHLPRRPGTAWGGVLLIDAFGRQVALLEESTSDASGRFCTPEGFELGAVVPVERGMLVSFHGPAAGNPFAKMLLLTAALSLEKHP